MNVNEALPFLILGLLLAVTFAIVLAVRAVIRRRRRP